MICTLDLQKAMLFLNKTYENMKADPRVKSFYLTFLFKAIFPYFKKISEQYAKNEVQAILHAFLNEKQRGGEIVLGYTISCIACKKKICGPLFDLSALPHTLICPHCGAKIDTDNDYLLLDSRYFFDVLPTAKAGGFPAFFGKKISIL